MTLALRSRPFDGVGLGVVGAHVGKEGPGGFGKKLQRLARDRAPRSVGTCGLLKFAEQAWSI